MIANSSVRARRKIVRSAAGWWSNRIDSKRRQFSAGKTVGKACERYDAFLKDVITKKRPLEQEESSTNKVSNDFFPLS